MTFNEHNVAECIGLWLAEGDNKTKREITFTNNNLSLIIYFNDLISFLYKNEKYIPRVYVYSKDLSLIFPLQNVYTKHYLDLRARKPYFLYRVASVNLIDRWKRLVSIYLSSEDYQLDILRGFFAGEGNIKSGAKSTRIIRIAQKKRISWLEEILLKLNIKFKYSIRERAYVIWGRESWDKLAQVNIAKLHSDKCNKFLEVYNQFKQYHYSNGFLKNKVYDLTKNNPQTVEELSKMFNRSRARVQEVLSELKVEQKVVNYYVTNKVYWISTDKNLIIISSIKQKYLNLLNKYEKTFEFARALKVTWKSAQGRLKELEKLGLVYCEDKKWKIAPKNCSVVVK